MRGHGLQNRAIAARSADRFGQRYVDLRIDLREWGDSNTTILQVGGRWDREDREWVDDGKERTIIRVHPGQYEAAYFFAEWLPYYVAGVPVGERPGRLRDVSVMFGVGGRGGGKSTWGVIGALCMAVAVRDRIVWLISPTEDRTTELQRAFEDRADPDWYEWLRSDLTYYLANGSRLKCLSGYDPETLKQGRVDFWVLNEAQMFAKRAYMMVRPRLADTSGLGFIAANPPESEAGQWVLEFDELLLANELPGMRRFEFDYTRAPTVDRRALETMRAELSADDYAREIEGKMIPVGDFVFSDWSAVGAHGNVRPLPQLGTEITARECQRVFGRPFARVVSFDFQLTPYMAATSMRIWEDPEDPLEALSWWCQSFTVVGLEEDLCDALEGAGFQPDETAAVCDASGDWQDAERTKGRSSFDRLRKRGWRNLYKPVSGSEKNPEIVERVKCAKARIRSGEGKRRAFSTPDNVQLNHAMKLWENRHGVPFRRSRHAHLCDTATYLICRFWPRRTQETRVEYEKVTRTKSARERDLRGL